MGVLFYVISYVPCVSQGRLGLTLTLLVAWIGANHANHTFAADDLAIPAHLLYRGCNFHSFLLSLIKALHHSNSSAPNADTQVI
jgi:hypothetical protein